MTEQEMRRRKAERYIRKCKWQRETKTERMTVAALVVIGVAIGAAVARR